mmetsp:Transcript_51738/g.116434  ORF Transcript_51738/g.116434 Transcript_51738/m.116434 type:complete len:213 (+) Transcript_51738:154-792(+)
MACSQDRENAAKSRRRTTSRARSFSLSPNSCLSARSTCSSSSNRSWIDSCAEAETSIRVSSFFSFALMSLTCDRSPCQVAPLASAWPPVGEAGGVGTPSQAGGHLASAASGAGATCAALGVAASCRALGFWVPERSALPWLCGRSRLCGSSPGSGVFFPRVLLMRSCALMTTRTLFSVWNPLLPLLPLLAVCSTPSSSSMASRSCLSCSKSS